MSHLVSNRAWDHSKARGSTRLVLLALAFKANDQGEATVPLKELAHLAGFSQRATNLAVAELVLDREIEREGDRYVVKVGA